MSDVAGQIISGVTSMFSFGLGFFILAVVLAAGSMQLGAIVAAQDIPFALVLPVAFFLGAAVGLRRPIVLYQPEQGPLIARPVIDLSTNPRQLLTTQEVEISELRECRLEGDQQEGDNKFLILHFSLGRHPVKFECHSNYQWATNVGFYLDGNLPIGESWLPYVQALYHRAKPLVDRYQRVDVCIATPASIAFALGMAFSRTPQMWVCHWFGGEYQPVLPLRLTEQKLPFD